MKKAYILGHGKLKIMIASEMRWSIFYYYFCFENILKNNWGPENAKSSVRQDSIYLFET